MNAARSESRGRGLIEARAKTLRVIVYAGIDPVTGKRVYLRETIQGTNQAARKRAEKALTKLLNQVNEQNSTPSTPSTVALSHALAEWMRTSELEESTRNTYEGYIERTIRPFLGDTAVKCVGVTP